MQMYKGEISFEIVLNEAALNCIECISQSILSNSSPCA